MASQPGEVVKNLPASGGDKRDTGGKHGNPFHYSCSENPMDRGAWWATGHRVTQSWTQLKQLSTAHEEYNQRGQECRQEIHQETCYSKKTQ